MSEPHFQKLKMNWLLRVAGYPTIKPLAVAAAVAMANKANSKTAIVNAKLSTLASDLGRSDDTGVSRGAAQLVELGFLKAKKAGRKVIWTVILDAAPKPPEESRPAKGHVKELRSKAVQARNNDACVLAQEKVDPDPANDLRGYASASCAGAHSDEISGFISEGKTAHAVFSQSVFVETEEQTTTQKTDQDVASDRALLGAVLPEEQCELVKDVFENVSNRELDILGDVIVTIGLQNFTTKLVNLAVQKDRGHSSNMTVGQWVEASGWRPIFGERAAGVHHHA